MNVQNKKKSWYVIIVSPSFLSSGGLLYPPKNKRGNAAFGSLVSHVTKYIISSCIPQSHFGVLIMCVYGKSSFYKGHRSSRILEFLLPYTAVVWSDSICHLSALISGCLAFYIRFWYGRVLAFWPFLWVTSFVLFLLLLFSKLISIS